MRAAALTAIVCWSAGLAAHDGPPFPIVSDRVSGAYVISIWTDPDATDDGSAGGQFWVRLDRSARGGPLPRDTTVTVAVRPLGRPGAELTAMADPVRGNVTNQFAALVMDHEGPFGVRVTIGGPLGGATVESTVDATYDLRPPPYMIAWYLMPFVLVAVLWTKLLLRRRAAPGAGRELAGRR